MARRPLKGSEKKPFPNARVVGPVDPHERLEVTVLVRRRARDALQDRVSKIALGDGSTGHIGRAEFARLYGANPSDLNAVKDFAKAYGLTVVQENAARRTIVLAGTVSQFNAAFGVELQHCQYPHGSFRGRQGPIQLPEELHGIVEAVLGLDNRPQAKPHFRLRAAAPEASSFTPTRLASLYNFPEGDGNGQCVAIIELGGGFRPQDLQSYFIDLNVSAPTVTAVSVDHGTNEPTGNPAGPDGEVMLDIEVVGALVPAASIAVYFAPNTDAGFLDAITTAIHDADRKPSVISISWGGPESSWAQQAMTAMDEAFQSAAAMGITVCCASGDNGSSDGVDDGSNHVDFPASSPYVLACGGTSLKATQNTINSEVVWNDGDPTAGAGGGGTSTFFPLPSWQKGMQTTDANGKVTALTHRGIPDVSADADPQTGYEVRVDGEDTVIGGTSAVAPLWAGLITRINALTTSPVGFINPHLYGQPGALRDITEGNNGAFAASKGWDACTGLGSPDGRKVAGIPGLDST